MFLAQVGRPRGLAGDLLQGPGLQRGQVGLVVGTANTASQKTTLTNSGAIANDGAFVVDATAADWALEGSSGQLGVFGNGFIGVMGSGDVGGFFSGNLAAISLQPQNDAGAPASGDRCPKMGATSRSQKSITAIATKRSAKPLRARLERGRTARTSGKSAPRSIVHPSR